MSEPPAPAPGSHDGASECPTRAIAYVRMSTDHQRYSTEHQLDHIRQYAVRRGLDVIEVYEDAGKSGLRLDGRAALRRLIDAVLSGRAGFEAILVYDVSRWGRFQDADESAYYEYVCKRAGITVHYCAEQFENDGSISSTIVKTVKRAMAGEYSRELSVKVFAGQCRLVELGFRQGGTAGLGLRRRLIDRDRNPKGELARGQHKSLQTDRVILVPGPSEEIETVHRMYRLFVVDGRPEGEIAAILNAEGRSTDVGRPWTRGSVHQVLTNEKYVGNNVYNRTSFKLKKKRVANSPDMWIRADGAFEAVIDPAIFAQARAIVEERSRRFSDADMLALLRSLFDQQGALSGLIIDECEGMPSSSAYRSRFGSLVRAYQLIGYRPARDYRYVEVNRALRRMHPGVVAEVTAGLERAGGEVVCDPTTDLLAVNDEFTASIVIARCRQTSGGSLRWKIRLDTGLHPDITVAIRMDAQNRTPFDYYLLPRIDLAVPRLQLAEENGLSLDAYRFETLDFLYAMAARARLMEAA